MHSVSLGAVNVSSGTATTSFSSSGFLSTAHVKLQELPTGKRLWLIKIEYINLLSHVLQY